MRKSRAVLVCTIFVVAGAGFSSLFASRGGAPVPQVTPAEEVRIYHKDPRHVWNRLHSVLFVRTGIDGKVYGQDRLEPLLWHESQHLVEDRSNARAVALLEEFVADGQKLIEDPIKRALIQRDLWMVFNWLETGHPQMFRPQRMDAAAIRAAKERLRSPLAKAIQRLALTPEQIRRLPDNYAAAIASGKFVNRFDLAQAGRPYLPADLFAAGSEWVCLGRNEGIATPQHLQQSNPFSNSVLQVYLRVPGGREAGLVYLRQSKQYAESTERTTARRPHLPKGSEAALVRRALLVDNTGQPTLSPLVESIELRMTVGDPPAVIAAPVGGRPDPPAWMSFHEIRLSRGQLLAGQAGGLRSMEADELDFTTGFASHSYDEFDAGPTNRTPQSFVSQSQHVVVASCIHCHFAGGLGNIYQEMPAAEVNAAAIKHTSGKPAWTVLQKLLAK
jgi:hypothetical protein